MNKLAQTTIYEDKSHIAKELQLIAELKALHPNGTFPLIEDPLKTKRTSTIGMFVLRPAKEAWNTPDSNALTSMYAVPGWAFNIKGLDGGWLVANANPVDQFRLGAQYGLSDAVMIGSTTVAKEGVGPRGHLWILSHVAAWLKTLYPSMEHDVMKQRAAWQKEGYLSSRKYPAQIVITRSGDAKSGENDFLKARIFTATHADGTPLECYILTSEEGAKKIRTRAQSFGLEGRIDDILIPLSPPGKPGEIDLARVPEFLYQPPYNMRIINHDGGQTILSEFSKAGVLPQMNLTLTRNASLYDVLRAAPIGEKITREAQKQQALATFDTNVQYFFPSSGGKLPKELIPVQIITDEPHDVAVVTFDARKLRGL